MQYSNQSNLPSYFVRVLSSLIGSQIVSMTRYSWYPAEESAVECEVLEKEVFALTAGAAAVKFSTGITLGIGYQPGLNSVIVWIEEDVVESYRKNDRFELYEELYAISATDSKFSDDFWLDTVGATITGIDILVNPEFAFLPNESGLAFTLDTGEKFVFSCNLASTPDDFALIPYDHILETISPKLQIVPIPKTIDDEIMKHGFFAKRENAPSYFSEVLERLIGERVSSIIKYSMWSLEAEVNHPNAQFSKRELFDAIDAPAMIQFSNGLALNLRGDIRFNSILLRVLTKEENELVCENPLELYPSTTPVSALDSQYATPFWRQVIGAKLETITILLHETDDLKCKELANEIAVLFTMDTGATFVASHRLIHRFSHCQVTPENLLPELSSLNIKRITLSKVELD